jgi:hypothetical protein
MLQRTAGFFFLGLMLVVAPTATSALTRKGLAQISNVQMLDLLKQLIDSPNPLIRTLRGIKDEVDTTFVVFVEQSSLDRISADAEKLDKIFPSILDPINNPQAIRKIAIGGSKRGTIIGGTDELERLQKESDKRANVISDLKKQRASIQDLADQYKEAVAKAQKVGNKMGDLASNSLVEITTIAGGTRLDLSWGIFESEVIPGLIECQTNAEKAVRRYDEEIKSATRDLQGFDDARLFSKAIFEANPDFGNPATLNTAHLQPIAGADIGALEQEMDQGTKQALETANRLRQEAQAIRQFNSKLANVQNFLKILGAGLSMSQQANKSTSTANKPSIMIYNKTENHYYLDTNGKQQRIDVTVPPAR